MKVVRLTEISQEYVWESRWGQSEWGNRHSGFDSVDDAVRSIETYILERADDGTAFTEFQVFLVESKRELVFRGTAEDVQDAPVWRAQAALRELADKF